MELHQFQRFFILWTWYRASHLWSWHRAPQKLALAQSVDPSWREWGPSCLWESQTHLHSQLTSPGPRSGAGRGPHCIPQWGGTCPHTTPNTRTHRYEKGLLAPWEQIERVQLRHTWMQENRLVAGSLGGALRLPFHPGRQGHSPPSPQSLAEYWGDWCPLRCPAQGSSCPSSSSLWFLCLFSLWGDSWASGQGTNCLSLSSPSCSSSRHHPETMVGCSVSNCHTSSATLQTWRPRPDAQGPPRAIEAPGIRAASLPTMPRGSGAGGPRRGTHHPQLAPHVQDWLVRAGVAASAWGQQPGTDPLLRGETPQGMTSGIAATSLWGWLGYLHPAHLPLNSWSFQVVSKTDPNLCALQCTFLPPPRKLAVSWVLGP